MGKGRWLRKLRQNQKTREHNESTIYPEDLDSTISDEVLSGEEEYSCAGFYRRASVILKSEKHFAAEKNVSQKNFDDREKNDDQNNGDEREYEEAMNLEYFKQLLSYREDGVGECRSPVVIDYRENISKSKNLMQDDNSSKILQTLKNSQYENLSMEQFEELLHKKLTMGELEKEEYGVRKLNQRQIMKKLPKDSTKSSERRKEHSLRLEEASKSAEIVNFRQINRDIKEFVRCDLDQENKTLNMPPQTKEVRFFVHKIAHLYGLKSTSSGKELERHCVISHQPSQVACVPRNLRALDKIIETAQKVAFHAGNSRTNFSKKEGKKSDGGAKKTATRPRAGEVIGADARPIDDSNKGMQMLRRLGWCPGQALGNNKSDSKNLPSNDESNGVEIGTAIKEPIKAIYKADRTGLGH